ncbi:MAG: hypothetical protein RLZZ15_1208 [Verrucomicrobiota bacterium]|jgi:flagellar protein FliO/FliZ
MIRQTSADSIHDARRRRAAFSTRARRLLACATFALVFVSGAPGADDNKILYPAGSASGASAPSGGSLGNVTLVVGLILAAAGGWLVLRGRRAAAHAPDGRGLEIRETRSLGNRQFLVVATYEEKKFLLGVCPGRIDRLAVLHDEEPPS